MIVTEHRAHACRCAKCGKEKRAAFPEDLTAPVQYGPRIAGIVVYLLHFQFLREQRLTALMADLFGAPLVTAAIAGMSRNCAGRFQGFAAALRDRVAAAAVKHMDETGFRIGGKEAYPVDSGSSICGIGVARDRPGLFLGLSRLMKSQ